MITMVLLMIIVILALALVEPAEGKRYVKIIIVTVIIMMIIAMVMMMVMMLVIMIMLIIVIITRSPPAPVEPWLRGTPRPAGKQTGPAAAAAKIQNFGIFHLLKVFCICQTFDILHFFMFCNNDNNGNKT